MNMMSDMDLEMVVAGAAPFSKFQYKHLADHFYKDTESDSDIEISYHENGGCSVSGSW